MFRLKLWSCQDISLLYNLSRLMSRAGVYIHIPFCRSRCSYCDFATGIYQDRLAERYVEAVVREIAQWNLVESPAEIETIYLGGGTPSMLLPGQVEEILAIVHRRFNVCGNPEVTMEMNPGNLELETLRAFKSIGINRASFGAQTFDDRELASLGRSHTSAQSRQTFRDLRSAGFQNISFDLIAGLPAQTLTGWNRNIDEALELQPEHLSFYLLEVHEGTPLAEQIKKGRQPHPDEDLAAEMYKVMVERSTLAGYVHYEISNLCRPGFESRHNSKYWTAAPYYGFGCSAHSYDGKLRRWANERDITGYVKLIEGEESPVVETWDLSDRERRAETVFLGLRLMRGINLSEYHKLFGEDLCDRYSEEMERLTNAGLIERDQNNLRLTTKGSLLSNEVFATFV
jgi:oxygen-independent coproporphyrinogen-3 oxidase